MNKNALYLVDEKGNVVQRIREEDGLYDIKGELSGADYSTLLDYAAEKRFEIKGGLEMDQREIRKLDRLAVGEKKAVLEQSDVEEFKEIMHEIEDLVVGAYEIVRSSGDALEVERARRYWKSRIEGIISGRGSTFTMADTLSALSEIASGEVHELGPVQFGIGDEELEVEGGENEED